MEQKKCSKRSKSIKYFSSLCPYQSEIPHSLQQILKNNFPEVKYTIFTPEQGAYQSSGSWHFQGYTEFKTPLWISSFDQRLVQLWKQTPWSNDPVHFFSDAQVRKGTRQQAIDYVKKEGLFRKQIANEIYDLLINDFTYSNKLSFVKIVFSEIIKLKAERNKDIINANFVNKIAKLILEEIINKDTQSLTMENFKKLNDALLKCPVKNEDEKFTLVVADLLVIFQDIDNVFNELKKT